MYKETTFNWYPVNNYEEIQENIKLGKIKIARRLLLDGNSSVNEKNVDGLLTIESKYQKRIEESFNFVAIAEEGEITARQAILKGILYGYKIDAEEIGFQPDVWLHPMPRDVIIDWAGDYYPGKKADLEIVFDTMSVQGLLFEVHPLIFEVPHYYCSYDSAFLLELDNSELLIEFYEEVVEFPSSDKYDTTWMSTGICKGQGSQSGGWPLWTCVGTSCLWFKNGDDVCWKGLKFNPALVQAYRDRVNPGEIE